MVAGYTGFDKRLKYLFDNATEVSATALYNSGIKIGTITIDGQPLNFYVPSSGGSIVSYNEGLQSGTLVGTLTIDGVIHNLYCTKVEANPQGQATGTLTKLGIDGTVYEIQGGGGGMFLSDYYDTTERVVGRWIDGKPLYQKTLHFQESTEQTEKSYTTEIQALGAEYIKLVNGEIKLGSSGNNDWYSQPFWYSTSNNEMIAVSKNLINIYSRGWKWTEAYATVQYTKTTDAPGTAPTPGNIIYLPTLYSTEEREVGVWTDGKPLYQITQHYPSIQKGTTTTINHNIQNVDQIFCVDANCKYNGNNEVLSLPYISTNQYYHISFSNITSTSFMIAPGSGFASIEDLEVTFQYTKTTDTPGSGTWTPDGQFSHHYSLSEQIIGTWVDDNTLYEISVPTGGSAPTGATVIDRISKTGYDVIQYTK